MRQKVHLRRVFLAPGDAARNVQMYSRLSWRLLRTAIVSRSLPETATWIATSSLVLFLFFHHLFFEIIGLTRLVTCVDCFACFEPWPSIRAMTSQKSWSTLTASDAESRIWNESEWVISQSRHLSNWSVFLHSNCAQTTLTAPVKSYLKPTHAEVCQCLDRSRFGNGRESGGKATRERWRRSSLNSPATSSIANRKSWF